MLERVAREYVKHLDHEALIACLRYYPKSELKQCVATLYQEDREALDRFLVWVKEWDAQGVEPKELLRDE